MSTTAATSRMGEGFTLPELVAVLTIVGVLAMFVAPRLSGTFAGTRASYDQVLAQVQFGRKAAIAQRRPVFVRIDAAQSRLCYSAAGACIGADGVASPAGQVPFTVAVPAGVTITAATFQFDALGRYLDAAGAYPAAALVITVSGDSTHQFTVERETGYAHP